MTAEPKKKFKTKVVNVCWVAMEYKDGWGLQLWLGNKKYCFEKKFRFGNEKSIEKVMKAGLVYVHQYEKTFNMK